LEDDDADPQADQEQISRQRNAALVATETEAVSADDYTKGASE
jgi:hypothetical protein